MTEDDLIEVNGLVARHDYLRRGKASNDALLAIELQLLRYGVRLKHAVGPPDPHAPPGGSTVALRKTA
jgi:hypothetical protein